MVGIARYGDNSYGNIDGHTIYPPTNGLDYSTNVFVEGKPVHHVGNKWQGHTQINQPHTIHSTVNITSGSPNILVNGFPLARVNDNLSCGDKIKDGSITVQTI